MGVALEDTVPMPCSHSMWSILIRFKCTRIPRQEVPGILAVSVCNHRTPFSPSSLYLVSSPELAMVLRCYLQDTLGTELILSPYLWYFLWKVNSLQTFWHWQGQVSCRSRISRPRIASNKPMIWVFNIT